MANQNASIPSWQSMQRFPANSSQSPPPSFRASPVNEMEARQQSSWQGSQPSHHQQNSSSQGRNRPSTATGSSSSSLTGAYPGQVPSKFSSATQPQHVSGDSRGQAFPSTGEQQQTQSASQQQQQAHRRTQSLRPMSAFQPLENTDYQGSPRPPSPSGSTSRSIRSAAGPLTFKSPELRSALTLQEAQNKKIYMEGYLSKRDHLTPDGKPLHVNDPKKRWQLCFVQLCGTVLSVWGVQQMEEAARHGTEVPPMYINVTDSFVDFIGTITESPQDVLGSRGRYENVFALNTAGQNRILFGVEGNVGRRLVQAWVNGIRLATWEKIRLEEIYTGSLVRARLGAVSAQQATSGPGGAPGDVEMSIKSPLGKNGRMEGWIKARFMGSTEWRKCWLVLSDRGAGDSIAPNDNRSETSSVTSPKTSFWSKLKAGDRGSLIGSPSTPSLNDTGLAQVEIPPGSNNAPGLACFYENKKSKKPFATLAYAAHTFAVYPSRPELVEGSSLFKVEGVLPLNGVVSATNRIRQSGWVMIMPEIEQSGGKGANAEMMKWCIAFMDAFRLYGRPSQFQWDARNPASPFFAYPIGPYKDRLFLDRELSEFLDIREERHLANRANLHGIMAARMRGERTPILPPLPQPNVESTRGLNGPNQQPKQEQHTPRSEKPSTSDLPPLNTGQNTGSSLPAESDHTRGQLSSIGERSREGSTMTSIVPTPVTPSVTEAVNGRDAATSPRAAPHGDVKGPGESDANRALAPSSKTNSSLVDESGDSRVDNYQSLQPVTTPGQATATPLPVPNGGNDGFGKPELLARRDSDPIGSYDEGILRYINSMGDSLPPVSHKEVASEPSRNYRNEGALAGAGAAAVGLGALAAHQTSKSSSSSHSTTQVSQEAPAQVGKPKAAQRPQSDTMDSDAFAASSYLDRPPSPPVSSGNSSRMSTANASILPAGSTVSSYPSSFGPGKKAQERKLAAQAQAKAHQDALARPGRPGGAKQSRLSQGPRHAWGDDEEDEDEDEDEEDQGDEENKNSSIQTPPPGSGFDQTRAAKGNVATGQQQVPVQNVPRQSYSGVRSGQSNSYLSPAPNSDSRGSSPGGSYDSAQRPNTFVHLGQGDQPTHMTSVYQPHGLLQVGDQEKVERSAKQQEADARAMGVGLVNVDNKPPPPQAGLVGAISAHERDRRKEGGLGATLTERERERVLAERRQREDEALHMQQQSQMMGNGALGWNGMPFNPMMWQQMQMMGMMNPMMFGNSVGSQSGHGHTPSVDFQQQQQAQLRAAQAAQQAYMQALQQSGSGAPQSDTASHPASPPMPPMSMGMMPFNPYMSMYGTPSMGGFPGWGAPPGSGSEMGGLPPQSTAGPSEHPYRSHRAASPPTRK